MHHYILHGFPPPFDLNKKGLRYGHCSPCDKLFHKPVIKWMLPDTSELIRGRLYSFSLLAIYSIMIAFLCPIEGSGGNYMGSLWFKCSPVGIEATPKAQGNGETSYPWSVYCSWPVRRCFIALSPISPCIIEAVRLAAWFTWIIVHLLNINFLVHFIATGSSPTSVFLL